MLLSIRYDGDENGFEQDHADGSIHYLKILTIFCKMETRKKWESEW